MESSGDNPRKIDKGPSLTAIAAMQELRQFAIAQRKPLDQTASIQVSDVVTDIQLRTFVDSAAGLRATTIYKQHPGKKLKDGRIIHELSSESFMITSINDSEAQKKDSRLMIVKYDDGKSPVVTVTFYTTRRKDHEFNLFVNFGDHPEIDRDEPLTYDSGRKKRKEMDTSEYEVISDLFTRAEKVFPKPSR